ncbi:MAG: hypothetical protein RMI34_03825 [Chloroherpetonaceae bacterium]|nr:hypothetical protein [Chloroherpetonaceae bacterium]MCS7211733.1 hypothetical protein [Chloroherpetonaceae bacterium]MDW8019188.1 hypothetical protein [Chloroherpetonaceae bacterium]MDW8467126.1 hypothetical protein [Chloroherpetonaceae bacterium]
MKFIFTSFAWLFLFIVIYRFLRFITTPLFVKLGIYTYHSEMLFTVPIWRNKRELHLGTAYDFFRTSASGSRQMLILLSKGLLAFCEDVERGKYPRDLVLRGTTHYFSDATLRKFGFKTRPLRFYEAVFFSLNYLELCLLLSISKRRLTVVNTDLVRIAYCRAEDLLLHKEMCRRYLHILSKAPEQPSTSHSPVPVALLSSGTSDSLAA